LTKGRIAAAHGRYPYTLHWAALSPLKIAHSHEGSRTYLIHGSLGSLKSTSQGHLDQFRHFWRAHESDR